jgi:Zn-dependent protease with chaperone function
MPILLLLVLTLACLWQNWLRPLTWLGLSASATQSALLSWSAVAVVVAAAALISRRTCRRLRRYAGSADAIHRRYRSWRSYHFIAQLAVYGLVLFVLGWGWTVSQLGDPLAAEQPQLVAGSSAARAAEGQPDATTPPVMLPGSELLLLAPFLVSLVLSWTCFYDAERAFHDFAWSDGRPSSFWSRWGYVSFHARQNLALLVLPLALLIAAHGITWLLADSGTDWSLAAVTALLLASFIGLPWVLRFVLRLEPFPEGPLRERLTAAVRRLNFRCSGLMVWNTHGAVANALVAGLVPWVRYVVFTDRLISDLTPDELEAVLGHEVGHVKHRHMLYYLGFLVISLLVGMVLWAPLDSYAKDHWRLDLAANQDLALVPLLGLVAGYIFVVFGFLSRRCERQADLFGCRAVSCARRDCGGHEGGAVLAPDGRGLCPSGIRTFIAALEKVAHINGIHRTRPGWLQSWQHSTIARRVEFLGHVLDDPAVEQRFQRKVWLVKWAMLAALAAVLLLVWSGWGWASIL